MEKSPLPYRVHCAPRPGNSALVFDTPHNGTILPRHFRYACATRDLLHLHDPHVEKLLTGIPPTGSPVLEARIHRSCIDLNRHEFEVDPSRIDGEWKLPVKATFYTTKNAGLFPVFAGPRLKRITPIYNEAARMKSEDGERRIADYYRPYYKKLHDLLAVARQTQNAALHLNIHSSHRNPDQPQADIVLGDLNGKACHPAITGFIRDYFEKAGFSVDFNGIYFSGGALIQKTHNTQAGFHSVQIEIARDLYMNQETLEFAPEKARKVQKAMTGLAIALKNYMARWPKSAPTLSPNT
ncbi:MAG: N-formylglutamate amidohydrolase [Micavibrio sp.]